jgi:hypothetical protein
VIRQYNNIVTSPIAVARLIPVIAHAVAVFGDEGIELGRTNTDPD